jgi:PAS domain S-box-containing protein
MTPVQPGRTSPSEFVDPHDRPTVPAPEQAMRPVALPVPEPTTQLISMQAPAGSHALRFGAGSPFAIELLPALVWSCSGDAVFDFLGPQWFAYTGIPAHEQLGRSFSELLHPNDRERAEQAFRNAVANAGALELDVRVRRHDGAFRWFRVRGKTVRVGSEPARLCGSCSDVEDLYQSKQDIRVLSQVLATRVGERSAQLARETARREQVQAEAERNAACLRSVLEHNQQLLQNNAELERFASAVSHDLDEPLRAIAGCAQLLQRRYHGQLDARADEIVHNLVAGAERMRAQIHDMLALSRVTAPGHELAEVASEEALAGALQNLSAAIAESAASISHDPMPAVRGDAGQLMLLFQNLIGNALKYRGKQPPEIHVSVQNDASCITFAVRDNGIGIEPADVERIFAPFQRLHTRSEIPGTGMGLAICKKIVERHGGRIWVESAPGAGSTFRFTLEPAAHGGTVLRSSPA